ncbi:MAG: FG-GAP repeat domain-containing protein, partial [Polyangiales bacterium]
LVRLPLVSLLVLVFSVGCGSSEKSPDDLKIDAAADALVIPDDSGFGAEVDAILPDEGTEAVDVMADDGKPKPPFKIVTLAPPTYVTLGGSIVAIATGDADGDGKIDVAALDPAGKVHVLLGKGDGSFAASVPNTAPAGATAITLGDVDGDGKADLAIAVPASGKVSVASGNKTATFSFTTDLDSGAGVRAIALADTNADSVLDIVFAAYEGALVGVHRHESDWKKASTSVPGKPFTFAVGDFDGDKQPDVVTISHGTMIGGSYLKGDGVGGFTGAKTYSLGPSDVEISIAAGDYDGDGKLDFAHCVGADPWGNFTMELGRGTGFFDILTNFGTGNKDMPAKIAQLAFVDLANIGFPHILRVDSIRPKLMGWRSGGGSSVTSFVDVDLGATGVALASADFDGDKQQDVVVALSDGRLAIVLNATK